MTTSSLADFFKTYSDNSETEFLLDVYYNAAHSKEDWICRMNERAVGMTRIFNSNEKMIDEYVKPFLNHEQNLTNELVSETAWFIYGAIEHARDHMLIFDALCMIEPYAEAHEMMNEHIITLIGICYIYRNVEALADPKKLCEYNNKLSRYKEYFDEIDDRIKKDFLVSLAKQSDSLGKLPGATMRDVLDRTYEVRDYYDSKPSITEFLGNGNDELAKYKKTKYLLDGIIAFTNTLVKPDHVEPSYEEALSFFEEGYSLIEKRAGGQKNVYIDYAYTLCKLRLLTGVLSLDNFAENAAESFAFFDNPENIVKETQQPLLQRNSIKAMLIYGPSLYATLKVIEAEGGKNSKIAGAIAKQYIDFFLKYVTKLPHGNMEIFVASLIGNALGYMLPYATNENDVFDIVYKLVIERDRHVIVHSHMVGKIATAILNEIFAKKPSMLVGCLGTKTEHDVIARETEFVDYMNRGALIHDLGKIYISFVTRKQTRKLTDSEFALIKKHPLFGAELAAKNEQLKQYIPLIIGHHKAYDNKGYPFDYDYREAPNAFLVSLLQVCDSLDAATDSLGRTYSKTKTSDEVISEFIAEKGTRYHPELTDFIAGNEPLRKELAKITKEGRVDVCYDLFARFII